VGLVLRAFTTLLLFSAVTATLAEPPSAFGATTLRWKNPAIRIAVSSSLTNPNPNIKTGTDAADVIRRSLSTWENVSPIKFANYTSEKQSVSPSGMSGDGVSLITIAQTPENLALFAGAPQAISAKTRVFYNRKGEITEADIVLNPYVQFSDDGTLGTFDLQSTLTHEIGHLLGLEHSFSLGAAMYETYGRNGLFGLQSRSGRTLSPEDISALRRLYGGSSGGESCCGSIAGRLMLAAGRRTMTYSVWAEDAESGRIVTSTTSQRGGNYYLEGLPAGDYKVYAQDDAKGRGGMLSFATGEVDVEKGRTSSLNIAPTKRSGELDVRFIGLNGQLAEAPIPVNSGRAYVVYFGGTNLNASKLRAGSNSKFITVNAAAISNFDFSDNVLAIRAEVTIDPDAPLGDYSIYLQGEDGNRRYIIGGIKVNAFVDPWDISSIFTR